MADTSALQAQANSYANQKAQKEREKHAIDQKITRLRKAKNEVATEKSYVGDLRNAVRKQEKPDDAWQGQKRKQYCDYASNDFRQHYNEYYSKADDLHDAIIRKIAELENQSRDIGGVIGWLASAINSLWAEIRAATN